MTLVPELDKRQTKRNARKVLSQLRKWERIAGKSMIDIRSPLISDMPRSLGVSMNRAEDGIIERVHAETERNAIVSALACLSHTHREILFYAFCNREPYRNYEIAHEVHIPLRSVERHKSDALLEFAEAYRKGQLLCEKK